MVLEGNYSDADPNAPTKTRFFPYLNDQYVKVPGGSFDSKISFDQHITGIIDKAKARQGIIKLVAKGRFRESPGG